MRGLFVLGRASEAASHQRLLHAQSSAQQQQAAPSGSCRQVVAGGSMLPDATARQPPAAPELRRTRCGGS